MKRVWQTKNIATPDFFIDSKHSLSGLGNYLSFVFEIFQEGGENQKKIFHLFYESAIFIFPSFMAPGLTFLSYLCFACPVYFHINNTLSRKKYGSCAMSTELIRSYGMVDL